MKIKLIKYKTVKSTNDVALKLIKKNFFEPTLIISDNQTNGRGRIGKKWISKTGNLFITLFFRLDKTKISSFVNKEQQTVLLDEKRSISLILARPDVDENNLIKLNKEDEAFFKRASIEIKYKGYIEKQTREINKNKKQNNKKIPPSINYKKISGLSNEVVEKLTKSQPETIGSASQIEGVTPAAINLILISIKKQELEKLNA